MDLLFLLPRVFLHCLSSYTVIDFSAIDCGFLLLCRSAGRGLLSAVSSRQLRKAPCAERDNEFHFVFVTFPRPLDFLLKTPFWALAPFRRRASGDGIFFFFFFFKRMSFCSRHCPVRRHVGEPLSFDVEEVVPR